MKKILLIMLLFIFTASVIPASNCNVSGHCNNYTVVSNTYTPVYPVANIVIVGIPINTFGYDYYYSIAARDRIMPEDTIQHETVKQITEDFDLFGFNTPVSHIFKKHCVSCHKPGKDGPGGVKLLEADSSLYVFPTRNLEINHREKILQAIIDGRMPKGRQALPASDIEVLRNWIKSF